MSKSITQPPDALTPGEAYIGHSAAAAAPYRDATLRLMQWQEMGLVPAPAGGTGPDGQAPSPEAEALVNARDAANREWSRLRDRAAGIERELSRPVFGMTGQQDPHLIERQAQNRQALEATRAAMAEIEKLLGDGQERALVQWAAAHPAAERVRGGYAR